MVITIICPGCEARLRVELVEGWAYGECSHCGERIEVEDGVVYDPLADELDEEFVPW